LVPLYIKCIHYGVLTIKQVIWYNALIV